MVDQYHMSYNGYNSQIKTTNQSSIDVTVYHIYMYMYVSVMLYNKTKPGCWNFQLKSLKRIFQVILEFST